MMTPTATGLPFISVIIPTYHDWKRLQLCIHALEKQTYPSYNFEVIIVNNDPADSPPNEFNLPDNFILATEIKPGSYSARNRGVTLARGEVLGFTDSDCIPNQDWLAQGSTVLMGNTKRIAGRVELFYHAKKLTLSEIYEQVFSFDQAVYAKSGGAATANMFSWKTDFDNVGPFNDSLMSGGDNEWGERAQRLGIEVAYSTKVIVKHPARHSMSALLKKNRRLAGGMEHHFRQNKNCSLMMILASFARPLNIFFGENKKIDINFYHKIIAINIFYFLKVHRLYQIIKLRTGVASPER
jgi:glycosyltransferase involved in cell wall biosynthesis